MLESRNVCLFPFQTQMSPHCTLHLSPGKIHAHIWNGLVQVQNTFLDVQALPKPTPATTMPAQTRHGASQTRTAAYPAAPQPHMWYLFNSAPPCPEPHPKLSPAWPDPTPITMCYPLSPASAGTL